MGEAAASARIDKVGRNHIFKADFAIWRLDWMLRENYGLNLASSGCRRGSYTVSTSLSLMGLREGYLPEIYFSAGLVIH